MPIPHVSITLADLAEEIGFAPAILLSGAYGGINIYIPYKIPADHNLAKLFLNCGVGMGAVMTLEQLYGGQTLNISPLQVYEELLRMRTAISLQAQGLNTKEIAQAMSINQASAKKKIEAAKQVGLVVRKIRSKKRLMGTVIQHLDNQFNLGL